MCQLWLLPVLQPLLLEISRAQSMRSDTNIMVIAIRTLMRRLTVPARTAVTSMLLQSPLRLMRWTTTWGPNT